MSDQWLTPAELAARWDVALRTLSDMRYRGTGPRFLRTGPSNGLVRYRLADVLEWERSRMVEQEVARGA